jgi:nitrite reductase/ring-hydroxylating ferredoxin subunit
MIISDLVQPDRIHPSLYVDAALFEREIATIFEKNWVWVAHDSEVATKGQFKSTVMGRQPVIVVRDGQDQVRVFLNRCRHRAASVCQGERGTAARFVCAYHGWTYALNGQLIGLPQPEGYTGILEKADLPLISVRTETYNGMIFASLKDDVEPLSDFLGEAKIWIDLFMKQGANWPIKVAGEHKFTFDGNWKIPMENTTDGYHLPIVHNSYLRFMDSETADRLAAVMASKSIFGRSLGNGHSVGTFDAGAIDLDDPVNPETLTRYDGLKEALLKDYAPDVVDRVIRSVGGVGFNLNIFPNIALSGAFFRELRPLAVGRTEVRHIALAMVGGPPAANRARLRVHEQFQGPAGLGSSDDREAWERVGRGASAGPDTWIMLNRGLNREEMIDGQHQAHATDETGMRAAYRHWMKVMADVE